MPTFKALSLCPQLVLLPVRFDLYRAESAFIREIFQDFTTLIEPISLDEAYLDVSHLDSESASIAWVIRERIRDERNLTASAGVAPNKFLAKIASDWNKPDGQFEILAKDAEEFLTDLPIERIGGVGKRTAERLHRMGISTCGELRQREEIELAQVFGKFGLELYKLCRGIDESPVESDRERKSLSTERTFWRNLATLEEGLEEIDDLVIELAEEWLGSRHKDREIGASAVKVKFEDFQTTTAQRAGDGIDHSVMRELLAEAWLRGKGKSVRLLGAAIHFRSRDAESEQLEMF